NTLVNNFCHPSVSVASDSYFSQLPASLVTSASNTYLVQYIKEGVDWKVLKQITNSSGVTSQVYKVVVTPPVFPACDATQPYFDGMQIGWGIVAAMISVAAIILIRRALQ
ncbi:MAG: hypothetical protein ABL869_07920, partial [Candidatus Nitrotoga sp.]